jgi:hypothetical protein
MGLCKECAAWQLGACRNLDYCHEERAALIDEARRLAVGRGHEMTEFTRWQAGHSVFEAHCERCGRSVRIDVNPGPGELDLYGEAIATDCPSPRQPTSEVPEISEGDQ